MAAEAAAAAILERLEALSCPVVLGGSSRAPPAALSLLCRPSGQRQALLRWLCARIHPPLSACLESLPEDAQMRELAKLGAQLMLCAADDLALVEGTAPPEQQLQFLQDLLDAVPPLETPPQSRPPKAVPFLLELLTTPEGGAALRPPHPPPIPVETSEAPPRPRRPLPELEAELRGLRRGLEELQAQVLGTLTQLGASAGEVMRLGGVTEAIAPQIPPLCHRFQPPLD